MSWDDGAEVGATVGATVADDIKVETGEGSATGIVVRFVAPEVPAVAAGPAAQPAPTVDAQAAWFGCLPVWAAAGAHAESVRSATKIRKNLREPPLPRRIST